MICVHCCKFLQLQNDKIRSKTPTLENRVKRILQISYLLQVTTWDQLKTQVQIKQHFSKQN